MNFDEATILKVRAKTKFDLLHIEKVLRLLDVLNTFFAHPDLKNQYVLKGGTALNLFYFPLHRLSVDIDLNYIGLDRQRMLQDRKKHEILVGKLLLNKGYSIKRVPQEHAGGKWRLGYQSFAGYAQNLEIDFNYMHRLPLIKTQEKNSIPLGNVQARGIQLLDLHELAAGKFCALLSRCKPRDLFDAYLLLNDPRIHPQILRSCFTVYASFDKIDFSNIKELPPPQFSLEQFQRELIGTLPGNQLKISPEDYLSKLFKECKQKISLILPFSDKEQEFLERVNHNGQISPELLSKNETVQKIIMLHPMLQWKVFNVRQYLKQHSEDFSGKDILPKKSVEQVTGKQTSNEILLRDPIQFTGGLVDPKKQTAELNRQLYWLVREAKIWSHIPADRFRNMTPQERVDMILSVPEEIRNKIPPPPSPETEKSLKRNKKGPYKGPER